LAALGGLAAVLAALSKAKGWLHEPAVSRVYRVAYGCMAISMVLFVVRGCGPGQP
jgi:hypothetical protein